MQTLLSSQHEVKLENELLYIRFSGTLEVRSLEKALGQADELIEGLREENKTVPVLVNVEKLENVRLASRKFGVQWLRDRKYDRIAVYGKNIYMKYFVNMLMTAIGNEMKYFDTREDAEHWLFNKPE